jgi:hypothetical protein
MYVHIYIYIYIYIGDGGIPAPEAYAKAIEQQTAPTLSPLVSNYMCI